MVKEIIPETEIDEYEQPNPQCVGSEFVKQYYVTLSRAPHLLFRFYTEKSFFCHGELDNDEDDQPLMGQKAIYKKINSLQFNDCQTKIKKVDSQPTLNNGIVLQVTGEISNNKGPMRKFMQTFVLGFQRPKRYFVINDIFRYQDSLQEKKIGELKEPKIENHNNHSYFPQPRAAYEQIGLHHQYNDKPSGDHISMFNQEKSVKINNFIHPQDQIINHSHTHPSNPNFHNWEKPIYQEPSSPNKATHNIDDRSSSPEDADNWDIEESALLSSLENLKKPFNDDFEAKHPVPHSQFNKKALEDLNEDQRQQPGAPKTYAQLVKKPQQDISRNTTKENYGVFNHAEENNKGESINEEDSAKTDGPDSLPSGNSVGLSGGPSFSSNLQQNFNNNNRRPFQPNQHRQFNNNFNNRPMNSQPFGSNNKPAASNYFNNSTGSNNNNTNNSYEDNRPITSREHHPPFSNANASSAVPSYPDNHQVFVGNLPHNMTDIELRSFFSQYGKVVDLKIISGQKGGNNSSLVEGGKKVPNYGFVIFSSPEPVKQLMSEKPIIYKGHRLNVEEKKTLRSGGPPGRSFGGNDRFQSNAASGGGPPPPNRPYNRFVHQRGGGRFQQRFQQNPTSSANPNNVTSSAPNNPHNSFMPPGSHQQNHHTEGDN